MGFRMLREKLEEENNNKTCKGRNKKRSLVL